MPQTSNDFVSSPVHSPTARPIQSKMFQYFTPENSPEPAAIARVVSIPVSGPPVLSQDAAQDLPQVKTDWCRKRPRVHARPEDGLPLRKKLSYPPRRNKSGRMKVNFKSALFNVLRKIDPAGTISSKAMDVLNDMMGDLLERIAGEAAGIRSKDGKATLMSRDIQTAARLILPGSLFRHAFYEAHRAIRALHESQRADK